jgi:hypothetical protein
LVVLGQASIVLQQAVPDDRRISKREHPGLHLGISEDLVALRRVRRYAR